MVRILLADDHEIVFEGIRTILVRAGHDWEICGEARDGKEAIAMARTLKPDVIVLDVTMPTMRGLEAAKQITKSGSCSRVLIFTMHESERLELEVRQTGAQGYVLQSQAAKNLVRAIEALLSGNTFFGSEHEVKTAAKAKGEGGAAFFQALAFA